MENFADRMKKLGWVFGNHNNGWTLEEEGEIKVTIYPEELADGTSLEEVLQNAYEQLDMSSEDIRTTIEYIIYGIPMPQ